MELLFSELPKAVGLPPFEIEPADADDENRDSDISEPAVKELHIRFRNAIAELANVYADLLGKIEMVILKVFGKKKKLTALRK